MASYSVEGSYLSKELSRLANTITTYEGYCGNRNLRAEMQVGESNLCKTNNQSYMTNSETLNTKNKSYIAAGIFALVLGGIGVHKFYNGSWGWGIIFILFWWTGLPSISGLIEGILYLTDEGKYNRRYNEEPPSPMKW